jgi:hypothetical protein
MRILTKAAMNAWAIWQLLRTSRRAASGTQAALTAAESLPPPELDEAELAGIKERAKAIQRVSDLWPSRIQCVQRSYALWEWLQERGFRPTMEVGWQAQKAHAWVRIGERVLNDHQKIGDQWVSLRGGAESNHRAIAFQEMLKNQPEWWHLAIAAARWQLTGEPPENKPNADAIDWRSFLTRIDDWGIGSAVDSYLLAYAENLTPTAAAQLEKRKIRRKAQNTAAFSEMVDIAARFRQANIRYIYLKGFSIPFASGSDLLEREMVDLDFLVHPGDLQPAHEVLVQAGYLPKLAIDQIGIPRLTMMSGLEIEYRSANAVMPVDLHLNLNELKLTKITDSGFFFRKQTDAQIAGNLVSVLNPATLALHSALHAARHFWFRLKWILDFAAIIQNLSEPEQAELITTARDCGNLHLVTAGMMITRDLLAIDLPDFARRLLLEDDQKRDELAALWTEMIVPGPSGRLRESVALSKATRLASSGWRGRVRWRLLEILSPDLRLLKGYPWVHNRLQVLQVKIRRRYRRAISSSSAVKTSGKHSHRRG